MQLKVFHIPTKSKGRVSAHIVCVCQFSAIKVLPGAILFLFLYLPAGWCYSGLSRRTAIEVGKVCLTHDPWCRQNTGTPFLSPQRCLSLGPWSPWMCYLPWQSDFTDVLRLRTLRWRDGPGLSERAQCNHKGPFRREGSQGMKKRYDSRHRLSAGLWPGECRQLLATWSRQALP